MMNFLVLGLIPGTNIQITFSWIAAFMQLGLAGFLLFLDYRSIARHTEQQFQIVFATALLAKK